MGRRAELSSANVLWTTQSDKSEYTDYTDESSWTQQSHRGRVTSAPSNSKTMFVSSRHPDQAGIRSLLKDHNLQVDHDTC